MYPGSRECSTASGQILSVLCHPASCVDPNHVPAPDNNKRYGPSATSNQHGPMHRRSGSVSNHIEGLHPGPELSGLVRPLGTPNIVEADVFPPARSQAPDSSIFLPYIPEDISFEEEYEEYLSDLGWSDAQSTNGPLFGGPSAWQRISTEFASDFADGISDSESIVSIGDLGDDSPLDPNRDDRELVDENLNNWEVSQHSLCRLCQSHDRDTLAYEPENYGSTAEIAGWPSPFKFRWWTAPRHTVWPR